MANGLYVTLDDGGEVYLEEITAPKKVAAMNKAQRLCYYLNIWEAYDRPSVYKVQAWENCKRLCRALKGDELCITGRNCMQFTASFRFVNPETGVCSICRITKMQATFCDETTSHYYREVSCCG